jgi:hypothetical protein
MPTTNTYVEGISFGTNKSVKLDNHCSYKQACLKIPKIQF